MADSLSSRRYELMVTFNENGFNAGVHPADELYAGSQQCNDDRHVWI